MVCDGPIFARNMSRLININLPRINCAPSWFYLQDYKVYLVSGNTDKTLSNLSPYSRLYSIINHIYSWQHMYTKRGLYSTQGVEINFREKKNMTEWPAVK